ncbi:MAG TPA: RNA-binding cell elongation regulator Jag/EloR [Anaerolineae bacterium]|nr:RNA-binding cell elongation regulator Jag/EloR [Anaerolineae bacterium]HNU02915.1 RNA-binding cell elongation regulator Jag/EloR [Anaerolineae bacterium]
MSSPTSDEFRGKSVEEATEAGLAALGLKHSQVEIEILSRGSRGLLGFGAEDARVRITRIPTAERETPAKPVKTETPAAKPAKPAMTETAAAKPPKPAKTEAPAAKPAKPAKAAPSEKPASPAAEKTPRPEAPASPAVGAAEAGDQDVGPIAAELLQGMLDRMDLRARVQVVDYRGVLDDDQDAPLMLNIEGEDLGILIGRRAETLAALQYLTRLMVNHRAHRWVNLVVDVEGYKARREEQLVRLAERMAERVVSTGRAVALEAMPPRERRIVHITLRNHPQVTTQSVGEGDQRKVTIVPR